MDEIKSSTLREEIWIRYEKRNPEKIHYFFIPEIKLSNGRKSVYGKIISVIENRYRVGRIFRLNVKWARQCTRKLEDWEVVKYKLLGKI